MKKNRKNTIIILTVAVILLLLCIPIPLHQNDGGTVLYRAGLYSVEQRHRMIDVTTEGVTYQDGTIVKILGFTVYNNVE